MTELIHHTTYKLFGLRVASELPMPELSIDASDREPDIWIRLADLTKWKTRLRGRNLMVHGHTLVLHLAGTAVIAVEQGDRIWISPEKDADQEIIRLCVTSTCMAAVLLKRGMLPLHGSAVVIDDKAYAFVGQSGAGKSTLAAALMNQGFPLLSDDVVAVSLSGACPVVVPSYPQQRLWMDSLQQLGVKEPFVTNHMGKYAFSTERQFMAEAVPLGGVFELEPADAPHPAVADIKGLACIRLLMQHTFRPFLIPAYRLKQWHFSTVTSLANRVCTFQIVRPRQGFTAAKLAACVVDTVRKDVVRNG